MFFIFALTILALINIWLLIDKSQTRREKICHIISIYLGIAGFCLLFYQTGDIHASNSPFLLAFLFSAILAFFLLARNVLSGKSIPVKIISVSGILASSLIAYSIINNFLFFMDRETSGFINPKLVESDTPCSQNAYIYFAQKGNEWHYRCPVDVGNGIFIVIGNPFEFPLVPWPDYYTGTSRAIGTALHSRQGN